MWLVGGGTFGRRAASGFAGGRKKSCELAEGGLFSSPLFFQSRDKMFPARPVKTVVSLIDTHIHEGSACVWPPSECGT